MGRVGRNDPCPCGSGEKFKRCCGKTQGGVARLTPPAEPEPASGWARAHATWPKTQATLTEHLMRWLDKRRIAGSFEEFGFAEIAEADRDYWMPVFISWHFYDWVPDRESRTVAAHWLAENGARERDTDVVAMIRAANDEPFSFFQVQSVEPGQSAVVRDLLTGEERVVVDRSFSEAARPWGVLFARLISFGAVTIFDALGHRPLGPEWADEVVRSVSEELGWELPVPRAALRLEGGAMLALYQDAVEEDDARRSAFRPELYTTEGEPLVFCEDTWKLAANTADEIAERVLELGATEDDASDAQVRRFTWTDGKSNVVIGGVTLRANRLVLESNSKSRQKKLKSKLVRALGRRIEHVSEKERTPEELMKGPRVVPEPSRVPPEIEKEAVTAALRSHYGSWPDTKLPALGGRTPRQYVKTKKGRAEVEAIIRDMEYKTHGTRMSGAYDFDELRAELGLRLKT